MQSGVNTCSLWDLSEAKPEDHMREQGKAKEIKNIAQDTELFTSQELGQGS